MTRLRFADLATGAAGSTADATLSGSHNNSTTTLTLAAALTYKNGTAVPTIASPDYLMLSILDANGHVAEVVRATAYTTAGTSVTVIRAQEGFAAVSHASGAKVRNAPTVEDFAGTVYDRRWKPGPGELSIDEHNDETLAGTWARVDGANAPSGNVVWTEGGDCVSAAFNGHHSSTNALNALMIPLSGFGGALVTGDAVYTCVTLQPTMASNYNIADLVLADGNTYGAGKQALSETTHTSLTGTAQANSLAPWTNYTTAGSVTSDATSPLGVPTFMRVVYMGSSQWRNDRSLDGISWFKGGTLVTISSFTPTHVGYGLRNPTSSALKFNASFEFLRRVAGVT